MCVNDQERGCWVSCSHSRLLLEDLPSRFVHEGARVYVCVSLRRDRGFVGFWGCERMEIWETPNDKWTQQEGVATDGVPIFSWSTHTDRL